MQIPVQVTFRDMDVSDAVEQACWRDAEKLERYGPVTSCRVVVSAPHQRRRKGRLYSVRIDLTVPGGELVVNRDEHLDHAREDVYVAIRDAFQAAQRQLERYIARKRGDTKSHELPAHGRVRVLVPEEDRGFIETPDGREIYFHRNSLLNSDFDVLVVGSEVRFVEEMGLKGPQATSVALVGRHHHLTP